MLYYEMVNPLGGLDFACSWQFSYVARHTRHTGAHTPFQANVTAHPSGASPFGVLDMVGNVWQYTDEFRDAHTRAVLVRGEWRIP